MNSRVRKVYMSGPPEAVAQDAYTHGPARSLEKLAPDLTDVVVVKDQNGKILERFWACTGERYRGKIERSWGRRA